MANFIFKLTFLSIFLIFLFLGANFVFAQVVDPCEGVVCSPAPDCPGDSWREYRCPSSACDGEIETRTAVVTCSAVCSGGTDACGCCLDWGCSCITSYSPWIPEGTKGGSWQKCVDDGNPRTKPHFVCDGSCPEVPQNDRYYDNPNYPTNPFSPEVSKDKNNIYLPVKQDWDDVAGWKDGWKEDGTSETCSSECVQSYTIRIDDSAKGLYSKVSNESEYNHREDSGAGACFLRSAFTHNWHVKACCNAGGTNCGSESNWNFTTNPSTPEPISPYDPDWNGTGYAEPIWDESKELPVILNWCDVSTANSYYMENYRYAPGEELEEERSGESYCLSDFCPTITNASTTREMPKILKSENYFSLEEFTKGTLYDWQMATCLNENGTKCGASCAMTQTASECADLGQRWSFFAELELFPPEIIFPKGQAVNMLDSLQWKHAAGANSYRYFIEEPGKVTWETPISADQNVVPFDSIWETLPFKIDTNYNWWVISCWSRPWEEKNCEEEISEKGQFRTTGARPTFNEAGSGPADGAAGILIPIKLNWDDMPGAASYRYVVSSDPAFTNIIAEGVVVRNSEVLIDYPDYPLRTNTQYWWSVKTCADEEGKICGFSANRSFKTITFSSPIQPSPNDNGTTFPPTPLSWERVPGAKFYQYEVDYITKAPEEVGGNCVNLVGTTVIDNKIVNSNSDISSLNCLGDYQWQVRACLDQDCTYDVGPWSPIWHFTILPPTQGSGIGLVPCGRYADDPNTSWDEREPCQIKHFFLMIKNLLDFLLWRVGLIILVLLIIATGVIFYFSMGAPATIIQIKSLWKAAGIGYGIIFLAWLIINLILRILGVTIQWWIINF